ncbi:hypothetical protein D3C87_1891070 [compost metagenome]
MVSNDNTSTVYELTAVLSTAISSWVRAKRDASAMTHLLYEVNGAFGGVNGVV